MRWKTLTATVKQGYGVASGQHPDSRFPEGSLNLQLPLFAALGLTIQGLYPGTLNLSIAPASYRIIRPFRRYNAMKWCDTMPAEDFSFFNCRVGTDPDTMVDGFIYYPHPETKPSHRQPPDTLEVITRELDGVTYGSKVILELDSYQLDVE